MDQERRRRVLVLAAGIVGLAVVIGLCLVVLVVLFDRFTAKPANDCAKTHCRSQARVRLETGNRTLPTTVRLSRP